MDPPQPILGEFKPVQAVLDRGTFEAEYRRVYRRLWLVAAGTTGDRTGADDLVQDAAAIALTKLSDFQLGTNFAAWMSEIVRRCALNQVRKTHHRGTSATDPLALDQHPGPKTPANLAPLDPQRAATLATDDGHFDDRLLRALNQLAPDARCCLLLRIVHQLSYEEISQILQMPQGTAMSHVHRAKHVLRELLAHDESVRT